MKKKQNIIDIKIKQILNQPMVLDFIPQYKSNLKHMAEWTLGELLHTVRADEDARDTLQEIIKQTGF